VYPVWGEISDRYYGEHTGLQLQQNAHIS